MRSRALGAEVRRTGEERSPNAALRRYRTLGRSGLPVSPLALGTTTFGVDWGSTSRRAEIDRMVDTYLDHGGNFLDTAGFYSHGKAELLLGESLAIRRERIVLATKYTNTTDPTVPNASGNSRRNMTRSVEASLRRLRTEWIDVLYVHTWDGITPVEEVLRGLDDLVRSGQVVYVGLSDVPVWQASRMHAIAEMRGLSSIVAVQIEYSLAQRTVERELIPMATELEMAVACWSPLAKGTLSKSGSDRSTSTSGERAASHVVPARRGDIARVVAAVAEEVGATPAQVALTWLLHRPGVTIPVLGARTHAQLIDSLGALDTTLDAVHLAALDEASAVGLGFPHDYLARASTRRELYGEDASAALASSPRWNRCASS